ncbi:hypothetical protein [Bradyrhizobium sp. LCT2]|uniref:DUF6894 family protein n=1 Tax=Bradyrhizobium sp. LCT2 TaxID=2493093 RepID=UPI00352ED313
MRYYFDYRDPDNFVPDETGLDPTGAERARSLALSAVGEATKELTAEGSTGPIAIEVRDENGPLLLVLAPST